MSSVEECRSASESSCLFFHFFHRIQSPLESAAQVGHLLQSDANSDQVGVDVERSRLENRPMLACYQVEDGSQGEIRAYPVKLEIMSQNDIWRAA